MSMTHPSAGFSLTELAIVLLIVALLLGGMVMPLSAQMDLRNSSDTKKQLDEIKEVLLGFAAVNGRLPCPDTDTDPTTAGYGIEEASCSADAAVEGFLPWKTLGVREFDAWGSPWQNPALPPKGHWRYRIERQYADATTLRKRILLAGVSTCNSTDPFPDDCLKIKNAAGVPLNADSERPIAIVFSVGSNNQADGENASYEPNKTGNPTYQASERSASFDDMMVWISRSTLANRMIAAGRLP